MRKFFFTLTLASSFAFADPHLEDLWFHKNTGLGIQYDLNAYRSEKVFGLPGFDTGLEHEGHFPSGQKDIIVAVLDIGTDVSHPYLKDSLARNLVECQSNGEAPTGTPKDKDGNGFAGDCVGWDFTKGPDEQGAQQVGDTHGHGTHVAGIIASFARYSASPLFKHIKILPLKVLGPSVVGLEKRITGALNYATLRGARVINFSMGWPLASESAELREAVKKAQKKGIIIVAAAGNNGHNSALFPCDYDQVICIGSNQNDGKISKFSNFGAHVDFTAPGSQILSSIPFTVNPQFSSISGFDKKSGTSQASPIITAFIAALLAQNPELDRDGVYQRLASASRDLPGYFALNGFPNFSKIFNAPESIVEPEFKEKVTLISHDDDVVVPFTLVNFGKKAKNVSISYRLQHDGLALLQPSETVSFLDGQARKSILVPLKITNLMADSFLKLEVKIVTQESNKTFVLNSQIMRKNAFTKLPGSVNSKDMTRISTLSSIKSVSKENILVAYKVKDDRLRLSLLRTKDGLAESGDFLVPHGETPLIASSRFIDLNGDGVDDVFLVTQKDDDHLSFYYLDQNLSPLYPKAPVFNLTLEESIIFGGNQDVHFPGIIWEGNKIRVPLFLDVGPITKSDLNAKFWDFKSNDKAKNIFWFEPKRDGEKVNLTTRTLSHESFRTGLLQNLNLSDGASLEILSLTKKEDSINLVAAVKDVDNVVQMGAMIRLVDLNSKPKIIMIPTERPLDSSGLLFPIDGSDDLLYVSAPRPDSASFYVISTKDTVGKMTHVSDAKAGLGDEFMDVTSITQTASGLSLFIQSKNLIFLLTQNAVAQTTPIIRHSFLDGSLASEFHNPVTVQTESTHPALYVDQTSVNGYGVYTMVEDHGKLASPLLWSLSIPEGCSTLNPTWNEKLKVHDVVLRCMSNGEVGLMKFSLKK
jgi:hypothetical protein